MKKVAFVFGTLLAVSSVMPAFASELKDTCMATAAAESLAEGEGGCDCMVEKAGDNAALSEELITVANTPAEERAPSEEANAVITACFPSYGG